MFLAAKIVSLVALALLVVVTTPSIAYAANPVPTVSPVQPDITTNWGQQCVNNVPSGQSINLAVFYATSTVQILGLLHKADGTRFALTSTGTTIAESNGVAGSIAYKCQYNADGSLNSFTTQAVGASATAFSSIAQIKGLYGVDTILPVVNDPYFPCSGGKQVLLMQFDSSCVITPDAPAGGTGGTITGDFLNQDQARTIAHDYAVKGASLALASGIAWLFIKQFRWRSYDG